MRVLTVAEIHGQHKKLKRILTREQDNIDLTLLAGNLGGENPFSPVRQLLSEEAELTKAIPGPLDTQETMKTLIDNRMNLHRKIFSLRGIDFIGLGSMDGVQMDVDEQMTDSEDEEIGNILPALLERTSADHQAILSYRNPHSAFGDNGGSKQLTHIINDTPIDLVICGEDLSQEERIINDSLIINPGSLMRGEYGVIDLAAGTADLKQL